MADRNADLKQAGLLRIYEALGRSGPVSRKQLAADTGLAAGTVSELIAALEARALVSRHDVRPTRGRPVTSFRRNPQSAILAGCALGGRGELQFIITDAEGALLHADQLPFPRTVGPAGIADLRRLLKRLVLAVPEQVGLIGAMGLAFPGVLNTTTGIVYTVGVVLEEPVNLAEILTGDLGFPVYLENLINASARGERIHGAGRAIDNFAVLTPTFGLGQYVAGALWRCPSGINLEFAHLKVSSESCLRCRCGSNNCIGLFASYYSFVDYGCRRLGLTRPPIGEDQEILNLLLDLVGQGDRDLLAWVDRGSIELGMTLANVAAMNSTEKFVIHCPSERWAALFAGTLPGNVDRALLPMVARPEIEFKVEDAITMALGSVALAAERLLF